jgi:hypothetical protein
MMQDMVLHVVIIHLVVINIAHAAVTKLQGIAMLTRAAQSQCVIVVSNH